MTDMITANSLFIKGEHKRAFDLYLELVANSANAIAASNVGYMYHRGIGTARNYRKAMAYYEAAAELDGGVAFFNMALMYMRGQGVKVDIKVLIKFFIDWKGVRYATDKTNRSRTRFLEHVAERTCENGFSASF
jgi:TPR repeat protein